MFWLYFGAALYWTITMAWYITDFVDPGKVIISVSMILSVILFARLAVEADEKKKRKGDANGRKNHCDKNG